MTLYIDNFPGPSLSAGWNHAGTSAGSVTVDGRLNFNIDDGGGAYPPADHRIARSFNGDLDGGYIKFWAGMPAVPLSPAEADPYLYVQVQAEDPFRFVTYQVFIGNPSFHPIGTNGYTMHFTTRYAPAQSAPNEYYAYDGSRPYIKLMFGPGTVTYQTSADGVTYADISTLTSGTDTWGSGYFDLMFNGYQNRGYATFAPYVIEVDTLEVSYTAEEGPTKTATAQWNVGVYDLAGSLSASAGRFSPVAG